jgi:cytochrome P450
MAALLEFCLLALIATPFVRAAAHPALRRAFPRTAITLAFLLLAGATVIVCLAVWNPQILHVLTLLAVVAALYALWCARPGRGRARRLPPGSLSLLPFGYVTDPYFFQQQIDRFGKIFKMNQFGIGAGPNPLRGLLQPVCCVDLKRGIEILRDHDKRLTPPSIPSSRFIPKRYLREMLPEDHLRYRHLFSSAFVPAVIDESAAFIAEHVRASLLQMADTSAAGANRGLAPERPLTAMTLGVFLRCFFGIFPDDRRYERLKKLFGVIDLSNRNDREVTAALEELARILRQQADQARAGYEDQPRSFLGEIARTDDSALDDLSVMRNLIYIAQASWIDTAGLIVWLFKELCDHPAWCDRFSEDISSQKCKREELSTRIVKETLRLRQSEYIYRKVLEEIPVADFVVPRGWLLRVCVRESHRNPRVFENPNTFNPDRFLDRRYSREEYSTFGASRISCLGEHLTMSLGRIFVEQVAESVATTVLRDGPPEYRRWHWKPSSKWRVRVTRLPCKSTAEMEVARATY